MLVPARCGAVAAPLLAAVVATTSLTACASLSNGHPVAAPPAPGASMPITAPAATVPATTMPATTVPATAAGPADVLCSAPTSAQTTNCLEGTLAQFWSGELNRAVDEPVVLSPAPADVPPPCRPALEIAPAFTCRADGTLYFAPRFLALISRTFTGADRTYALASVQAHEMGHIVQYAVGQPQLELRHPSDAQSRFVEQQADCLSGVWAAQADGTDHFDAARFQEVAVRLVALISTDAEIRTHGSPPQRSAAIERGVRGGRPQACHLATFH